MRTYANFTDTPLFITLALVIFFGIIVIAVMLLKKYAKPFMSDEKPKSDKEIAEGTVNVRRRGEGDIGAMKIEDFIAMLQKEIADKK